MKKKYLSSSLVLNGKKELAQDEAINPTLLKIFQMFENIANIFF